MTMEEVAEFYEHTICGDWPDGNLNVVAKHFGISRAKVYKILITMKAIDSPVHQDVILLKAQDYSNAEIAEMLGVSVSTVSINLPYEKPMYGLEEKSQGAVDVENFRKREKKFKSGQKKKIKNIGVNEANKQNEASAGKEAEKSKKASEAEKAEKANVQDSNATKANQSARKVGDFELLHVELLDVPDVETLKKFGGVKYGRTVSRDVLVPFGMPLHNLHYLIQQLFGFQNSHLHKFQLPEDRLLALTSGKAENWLELVGVLFKNPLRDSYSDFWDDDYEKGSVKKYMRSKYIGPYLGFGPDESYPDCRRAVPAIKRWLNEQLPGRLNLYKGLQMEFAKIDAGLEQTSQALPQSQDDVLDLRCAFDLDAFDLLERLSVSELLNSDGSTLPASFSEFMETERPLILRADTVGFNLNNPDSQPYIFPVTNELIYNYDYDDNWQFSISAVRDVQNLVDQGRLKWTQFQEDIQHVCATQMPVLIAADGYNLVEDVGGPYGYCDFLRGINGLGSDAFDYSNVEETLMWARGQGWKKSIPTRNSI